MVWSKAKRLRLYRLAISSVTQDIQNGSSFLLFKLEPLDRSHEVNRLLRAQRAEGRGYRRSGWGGGSRLLAGLSAFILDQEVFYVTIATKLGFSSPVLTGWALHFLVGLVAGGVFIA